MIQNGYIHWEFFLDCLQLMPKNAKLKDSNTNFWKKSIFRITPERISKRVKEMTLEFTETPIGVYFVHFWKDFI